MKLKPPQQELIDRVRRDLGPNGASVSDEEILEHWQGSLEMQRLELAWSFNELKREIKKVIPAWLLSKEAHFVLASIFVFVFLYSTLRSGWQL